MYKRAIIHRKAGYEPRFIDNNEKVVIEHGFHG